MQVVMGMFSNTLDIESHFGWNKPTLPSEDADFEAQFVASGNIANDNNHLLVDMLLRRIQALVDLLVL